jgi:hypothetical protein
LAVHSWEVCEMNKLRLLEPRLVCSALSRQGRSLVRTFPKMGGTVSRWWCSNGRGATTSATPDCLEQRDLTEAMFL